MGQGPRRDKRSSEPARVKKGTPLLAPDVTFVDYKDVNLLRTFISDRGKIRSRRVTGLTPQQQRQVAHAAEHLEDVRGGRERCFLFALSPCGRGWRRFAAIAEGYAPPHAAAHDGCIPWRTRAGGQPPASSTKYPLRPARTR